MFLLQIGQKITIYFGLFLLISGIIGNGMNILVFLTVPLYRRTPCTFYFLIGSMINIAYITINLLSRIVSVGFDFDLTHTSVAWCKARQFFLFTLGSITLTCSCLATIDQYFCTSSNVKLREFSNIKWTHRIVLITIFVWCLHGIFPVIYFNIPSGSRICINTNAGFGIYGRVYLLSLVSTIPVLLMLVFGYLTYRNIHLSRLLSEKVDRQLTRMILIQVILVALCITPYGINSAYSLITSNVDKDADRLVTENFASMILSLLPYVYYSGSCYMFAISSSRFRRTIRKRICCLYKPNYTVPINPDQLQLAQR